MLKDHYDSFATAPPPEGHVYENPSADKFGPPPSSPEPPFDGPQWRRLIRIACAIGIYIAGHWLQVSFRSRGWLTAAAIVVFGYALRILEQRIRKDEGEDEDPYSPPTHVTR